VTGASPVEPLLRELAPVVLGVLTRRTGDFDGGEDAVQEALLAAAAQWPVEGVPANPTGWLVTVAHRRWTELVRRDAARRRREVSVHSGPAPEVSTVDDSLALFVLCCHPALTRASQVALTLRAVGGLTTAEVARALLVPESTVAQRISRAKATIRAAGSRFDRPSEAELPDRLAAVCAVLYLVFNEGYTATSGPSLHRPSLTGEAVRLARQLHAAVPADGEVAGLLALMLLTEARRAARTTPAGALVPLESQDRSRWDRSLIAEGTALLASTLRTAALGPYQLQAAIAAVHDEAPTAADTDWAEILGLYELLAALAPGPMVTLNRLVALAMVRGPAAGLAALDAAAADPALARHHRLLAVRAHLLERAGDPGAARAAYRLAAARTLSEPERAYLTSRAGDLP
jgi:RNA polymerase sigma factor (sigma-70 family)